MNACENRRSINRLHRSHQFFIKFLCLLGDGHDGAILAVWDVVDHVDALTANHVFWALCKQQCIGANLYRRYKDCESNVHEFAEFTLSCNLCDDVKKLCASKNRLGPS